ncbi:Holliday junction resolvase RuvX [Persicimonas caeni]|uniref:Putative pre-16S rRNA nuclease n=1 Tax=Persicimonas caeni TaxID=2292766 RepID=A0A4Y6Q3I4_PERCE|nr:Holliday junction resolvase RuvX [Persicimonas caeni]QDG54717.1 Holliday junction resolvase RuvX [Persicimonas caeni]QED35938.1 Holliday junction resolvase RuvX [Persicimonas caeni]
MAPASPYIGLDVGTKRIGVAKSDRSGKIAMPHETVDVGRRHAAAEQIAALIEESECHTVVVGWPLTLEGAEGRAVRRVEKFIERLEAALEQTDASPEIVPWDERLTTTAAETFLIGADVSRRRRKKVVDQIAASHILQGYLDSLSDSQ